MDFTALISVLSSNSSPLLVALAAIAGVMILPGVARWGYDQVVGWFSPEDDDDDEELDTSEMDNAEFLEVYPNYDDCPDHLKSAWDFANRAEMERAFAEAEDDDDDGSYGRGRHGDYE